MLIYVGKLGIRWNLRAKPKGSEWTLQTQRPTERKGSHFKSNLCHCTHNFSQPSFCMYLWSARTYIFSAHVFAWVKAWSQKDWKCHSRGEDEPLLKMWPWTFKSRDLSFEGWRKKKAPQKKRAFKYWAIHLEEKAKDQIDIPEISHPSQDLEVAIQVKKGDPFWLPYYFLSETIYVNSAYQTYFLLHLVSFNPASFCWPSPSPPHHFYQLLSQMSWRLVGKGCFQSAALEDWSGGRKYS